VRWRYPKRRVGALHLMRWANLRGETRNDQVPSVPP
jgi:hypothetical protein